MAAVAGLRGTGDWGTDERPKDFREMILYMNPNGTSPITALTARAGKMTVRDSEFSWWNEPNTIVRVRVNKSGDYGTTETTIEVDSSDPAAGSLDESYGNATHLKPGDVLLVEPSADNATYDHEHLRVTSVIDATTFTVQRGFAGTTAAAITDNSYLLLIGSSYTEGTPSPVATSRNPIKDTNFCQIFKTSYEVTGTAAQTFARTGDILKNERMRKAFDHARAIEMAILFGQKNETTGSNGKPQRTMKGLRGFIPAATTTIFSGAPDTTNDFLEAVWKVFDFDTPAGDQRIGFCSNKFLIELNKIVKADASTQLQSGPVLKQFGMDFRTFVMPQGELFLRTHPLLNRMISNAGADAAPWYNSCFIIDFASLKYVALRNRDTKFKDNVQNNDEDTVKGMWTSEVSIRVDRGGRTMGYLGSLSAT